MSSISTAQTTPEKLSGTISLPALVLSRICTNAIFMTYPACLAGLMADWEMSATQAGLVQGVFTAAFAVSLLIASFACDRYGAKRVYMVAVLLAAIAAILFALFARSFATALFFVTLLGLSQGGTYTPAVMIVAANTPLSKRASGVGWVVGGMPAGYVISIFLATTLQAEFGYEWAFIVTAAITVPGWLFGVYAVRNGVDPARAEAGSAETFNAPMRRRSRLLILGYIGHCWELFGMWAWVPAFLAAALATREGVSATELGLWTALALHLSGFIASFASGYAADRFGARRVLIVFAILGALCSVSIGWMVDLTIPLLLAMAAIYGFTSIGDSSVLTAAMTDTVPAGRLGRALGLRSVLGVGAGAISPAFFGLTLDVMPAATQWGFAFLSLGLGGVVAIVCAVMLKR